MSKDHEVAAAAANQLTEQPAVQQLAAKQALKQVSLLQILQYSLVLPDTFNAYMVPEKCHYRGSCRVSSLVLPDILNVKHFP